jgi:hypothetical protein
MQLRPAPRPGDDDALYADRLNATWCGFPQREGVLYDARCPIPGVNTPRRTGSVQEEK